MGFSLWGALLRLVCGDFVFSSFVLFRFAVLGWACMAFVFAALMLCFYCVRGVLGFDLLVYV